MTQTSHACPAIPTWKPDWADARKHHEGWWRGEDLVFSVTAPRDQPHADLPEPEPARDAEDAWVGLPGRVLRRQYKVSQTFFGADAVPHGWTTCVGAGDLAAMLGAGWHFAEDTVWFEPCITDPDAHPPLTLDRDSFAFQRLTEMIELEKQVADGCYFVGIPDLVENFDILAALRGAQDLLMETMDRPEWVLERIDQINDAYFQAFNHFYELIRQPDGAGLFSAFNVWAPGKAAKVQCDACAMFGPDTFRQFVQPALARQCDWLDYSIFHLDGEDCLPNVDALLEIESLDAVEWTPAKLYIGDSGGNPEHYGLYKRIRAAGKSVQAIEVRPDEVIPLLDAVGPAGMYVICNAATQAEAERLIEQVQPYYAKN